MKKSLFFISHADFAENAELDTQELARKRAEFAERLCEISSLANKSMWKNRKICGFCEICV